MAKAYRKLPQFDNNYFPIVVINELPRWVEELRLWNMRSILGRVILLLRELMRMERLKLSS